MDFIIFVLTELMTIVPLAAITAVIVSHKVYKYMQKNDKYPYNSIRIMINPIVGASKADIVREGTHLSKILNMRLYEPYWRIEFFPDGTIKEHES